MLGNSIGISIGTRSIGVAVFEKGHLLEWQVKSFKEKMSTEKLRMISDSVLKLMKDYGCTEVIFKTPYECQTYTNLAMLKKHLVKTLTTCNYSVHFYSISEIKAALGDSIKNKQKLIEWGARTYKQLGAAYEKERKIKNCYYTKLFEAVAVLHVHIHRQYD
ncbi:hypothetical protein A3860_18515 [Niastella vici]|uniref:Holliday junction resolvase RuvC n=1 Tax=Niastella vici TaxID=1703345 RepID=A0A1V9G2A7_9BACT|nr:hypothetical protein [Niastella vici]OQP64753.1 hypothetical protein A3860_18515 [Niastella vici]